MTTMPTPQPPAPASHIGGCPCPVCQGERVELDRCLAILEPELTRPH